MTMCSSGRNAVISGSFPNVLGLTWLATADANFNNPLLVDRNRLGGIAREDIPSPEYARVPAINGADTGVEIASIRQVTPEATHLLIPAKRLESEEMRNRLARAGFATPALTVPDDDGTPYTLFSRTPVSPPTP